MPRTVKLLLLTFIGLSLLACIFDKLVILLSGMSIMGLLGISLAGWQHYFWWQPLTFFLLEPSSQGFSLSFVFDLFFDSVLLAMCGSALVSKLGGKKFIFYFLLCGISAGLLGIALLNFCHDSTILLSPSAALFGLIMIWIYHYPKFRLPLFPGLQVGSKLSAALLMVPALLGTLSEGKFMECLILLFGIAAGFTYPRLASFFRRRTKKSSQDHTPEVVHGTIIDP